MKIYWKIPAFFLIGLILAGCSFPGSSTPTPAADVNSVLTAAAATAYFRLTDAASNLSPTPSVTPTETPAPAPTEVVLPTSIPTIVPIPGEMDSNANVRSIPQKSKTHDIGGLFQGQAVKVIARNDAATWLLILYADSPTGTGWVLSKAIRLSTDMSTLPIMYYPNGLDGTAIMLPPFIFALTGTPEPPSAPPAGWSKYGTLTQPANVRVGPSVGYMVIGVLKPGQKVTFSGHTDGNDWVQINYPSGPDGHGWILSELLQANDGYGGLVLYDLMGTPVTPTPEGGIPTTASSDATAQDTQPAAPTETPAPPSSPLESPGNVTNQINVRSGPAGTYKVIGMLNPKDKVTITGLTMNHLWYQIQFSGSPDGIGWVSSQYVQVLGDMNHVPYYYNEGTKVP